MDYRRLGKSGLRVSEFSFGAWVTFAKQVGEDAAAALETLMPVDVVGLGVGKQRYGLLTNDEGGIIDDLMFANRGDHIFIIVNGACKHGDLQWMQSRLAASHPQVKLTYLDQAALLAFQGPQAVTALSRMIPGVEELVFMTGGDFVWQGISLFITRSGYTGEDGFEISVPAAQAQVLARALLAQPEVKPIGLGARNSLRLEAGLCLYGHELDETISPVEADLLWSISKRRRAEGGFIGAARVQKELAEGVSRKRVGLKPEGRAPAREGTVITDGQGREIGKVTSGGFGPSVGGPIAMGYVEAKSSVPGTKVNLLVRGTAMPAEIVKLPFIPNRFKR